MITGNQATKKGPYILTADIGGSHITAAICDMVTDTIVDNSSARIDVKSKGSAESILSAWKQAFDNALQQTQLEVSGLGMAMPGPFDYENGISYIKGLDKYESLYGLDIKTYFADLLKLDKHAVKFRNDAEATIAGEVLAGAGKGFHSVMGVTLGTGFGSAYCKDQKTWDLNLGSDPFKDSIADDHLSTRWFLKRYNELTGLTVSGVKELALLAETNLKAKQIFEEFGINMAIFLAEPLNRFKPDILLLCGNIAKASGLFLAPLKLHLQHTAIIISELGEQAALIGAAELFKAGIEAEVL